MMFDVIRDHVYPLLIRYPLACWFATFAGSELSCQRFFNMLKYQHIFSFGCSGLTGRSAENARCLHAVKERSIIRIIVVDDGMPVFFIYRFGQYAILIWTFHGNHLISNYTPDSKRLTKFQLKKQDINIWGYGPFLQSERNMSYNIQDGIQVYISNEIYR